MGKKIRVGVIGANGKMGSSVVAAVQADAQCELAVGIDIGDSLEELLKARCEVVVDFTNPTIVMENLAFCIKHGIDAVVGTSGFTPERIETLELWAGQRPNSRVLIAPNFSMGAVLMVTFAAIAAPYFESVEIVESHHPEKVDAPSGTARFTAQKVAVARRGHAPSPDATDPQDMGARGISVDGVPIHSVRLRGMVAHQEVLFGSIGETLTITHDSLNRDSFMQGVLIAIKEINHIDGVVVGLENVLPLGS
jgi:4-hydroxy-tetrahydrodipicolinate reductase|tara:strand:- start:1356 stop:2108 length:753 start_codon:yes stop_codon:yes gene_type:complete